MRKSRFTEEQIIAILAEQERGETTAEVCRRHGISSPTFYKWKAKFGGMDVSDARKLNTSINGFCGSADGFFGVAPLSLAACGGLVERLLAGHWGRGGTR